MRRFIAGVPVTIVLAVLAIPGLARGESKDKCVGSEGISPELLEACNQAAYDRCRPSYQKRCVDGVVKDFRLQTKERGQQGEQQREAASEAICDTDTFVAECTKANEYARSVCNVTDSPVGNREQLGLDKWLALFARAPEAGAFWAGFAPKYPRCTRSVFKCCYNEFDRGACAKVEDKYRALWGEYRADLARKVEAARQDVAALAKNPFDWAAAATFDQLAKDLADAGRFKSIGYLKEDGKDLDAWSAWIVAEKAKWQANREAALEKVRCPVATNRDAGLTTLLRGVLDEHGRKVRNPESKMVERIGSFGLLDKAVQSHQSFPPVTHEDQGGFACVHQEKEGKTTCRILKFTFRRSKPAGGKFGSWGFYSVGGGDEMSCKNVK